MPPGFTGYMSSHPDSQGKDADKSTLEPINRRGAELMLCEHGSWSLSYNHVKETLRVVEQGTQNIVVNIKVITTLWKNMQKCTKDERMRTKDKYTNGIKASSEDDSFV